MIGVEAQAEYRKSAIDTVRQLSIDVGQTLKKISVKEAELNAIAGVCTGGNPRPRTLRCIRLILRLVNTHDAVIILLFNLDKIRQKYGTRLA